MSDNSYFQKSCECTVDYSEEGIRGKPTIMLSDGKGNFTCPKCGAIEDYSNSFYKFRIKFEKKKENGWEYLDFAILEPMSANLKDCIEDSWGHITKTTNLEMLEEEIREGERFKNHREGIFDIELIWYSYRCSYEYEEYETEFEVQKETEISFGQNCNEEKKCQP